MVHTDETPARKARTIKEHCDHYGYSNTKYFQDRKAGRGPKELRLGSKIIITPEADEEWRRWRENPSEVEQLKRKQESESRRQQIRMATAASLASRAEKKLSQGGA
jgi:hypothetical protein